MAPDCHSAQRLQGDLFQRQRLHPSRQSGMEDGRRIRCHISARKLQIRDARLRQFSDSRCPINLGIFDAGATTFAFTGSRPDLEQSAYVQDLIRLGNWTLNAGVRWDHYQLLVNQNAVSPRVAVSRYFRSHRPESSRLLRPHLPDAVLRKYSAGEFSGSGGAGHQCSRTATAGSAFSRELSRIRSDESLVRKTAAGHEYIPPRREQLRRRRSNTQYRDQLSHRVSKGILYGAEAKIEVPHWGRFSGFAQLFLYCRKRLEPGNRRPVSRG